MRKVYSYSSSERGLATFFPAFNRAKPNTIRISDQNDYKGHLDKDKVTLLYYSDGKEAVVTHSNTVNV